MQLLALSYTFVAVLPILGLAQTTSSTTSYTDRAAVRSSVDSAIRSANAAAQTVWASHNGDPQKSALDSWLATQTVLPTDALDKPIYAGALATKAPQSLRKYISSVVSDEKIAFSTAISSAAPGISSALNLADSSMASNLATATETGSTTTNTRTTASTSTGSATASSAATAGALPMVGLDGLTVLLGAALAGLVGVAAAL